MILLIVFFSLLLVLKTGSSGLINLGDSLFPFFPQQSFSHFFYAWDSGHILGRDNAALFAQAPWYGLAALLDRLGFPLWLINRLWFALPFFLLGLSMYFLSGVILGKEKKLPRLIATLFFMFNPFALNLLSGSVILTLAFTAGVFVFGLFVRGLERFKLEVKDVILLALASIFAAANTVVLVMVALLCVAYFLFFVVVNRNNRQKLVLSLKFVLCAMCYVLLANAWWLIPFVYQFLNPGYFTSLFAAGTDVSTLEFASQFTSLFNVSRLFYGYTPTANFPISHYYHYLLSPTMMSILVVLVFSIALCKKKSPFELFFLLLALFSVILAAGTRPPFGFFYQFLWDHIPYFQIFRTTNRFNLYTMMSYAILLGFSCQHIRNITFKTLSDRDSDKPLTDSSGRNLLSTLRFFYEFFIISFIFISILLSAWPLLTGDIYGQLKPHQIPQGYYELREFLEKQEGDFRVMSLPMKDWLTPYSWSAPFDMQELLIDFSPQDVIVNPCGFLQDLEEREIGKDDPLYAMVAKNPGSQEALEALKLMGVRYLVVHRDYVIVWGNFYPVDVSELIGVLQAAEGIKFVKSFGDLDVYEVEDVRPRIYADGVGAPPLIYERLNPGKYRIEVKGAESSYDLVLAENFNSGWRLSAVGKPQGSLTRNFGNIWRVDKKGDYTLNLSYWPQKLLEIGAAISVLSLVIGLGGLVYFKVRK